MCISINFDEFIGKKAVVDGENGEIYREDLTAKKCRERRFVIRLNGGKKVFVGTGEYDFSENNDIVMIVSKPKVHPTKVQPTKAQLTKVHPVVHTVKIKPTTITKVFWHMPTIDWPSPSQDSRIYHSTSVQNMKSIIKTNGLYSRWQLLQMGKSFCDTANSNIMSGRQKLGIENMIPFHFYSKTPYEYGVFKNVKDSTHNTVDPDDMVVIAIDKHKYDNCSFVFTAHPLSKYSVKMKANDPNLATAEFWQVVDFYYDKNNPPKPFHKKYWNTCMAEYDVGLSFIPLSDICVVHVQNNKIADILQSADIQGVLKGKIVIGDKRYLI